jgi:MinD-like ATPase involved in chromosome partitioning or flagellar assembly
MKTISVHSYKGGTGKTTFLLNIAGSLAKEGAKTIAVDYDLRAPSFQSYFKVENPRYLSDFLLEGASESKIIFPCTANNGVKLDLIFSSMEFLKQHSKQRDRLSRDDSKYLAKLYQLQSSLSKKYEYMLIDTIPGFFYRSIDSMMVSDVIIVIATPSVSNILGLTELTDNIYAMLKEDTKMILLINKIDEEGTESDKELFEKNLSALKRIGKEKFSSVLEIPYFNILSEKIYAFEEEVPEEFMISIKELLKLI